MQTLPHIFGFSQFTVSWTAKTQLFLEHLCGPILMGMHKISLQGLAFARFLKIQKILGDLNKMLGLQALKAAHFFLNFSSTWIHYTVTITVPITQFWTKSLAK